MDHFFSSTIAWETIFKIKNTKIINLQLNMYKNTNTIYDIEITKNLKYNKPNAIKKIFWEYTRKYLGCNL